MKTIVIQGKDIHGQEELHDVLQARLELGPSYGRNLDALWDCLTGFVSMPLTIQWIDFDTSRKYLGEYADLLLDLMQEAEEELEEFTFDLII
ncbi:barstar family protein [Paenibacillus sp. JNUCC31]|uniref:barstar family protein n=1 Tax=Paenibacillus sp. JNUCC-31 TaxID=2777983 RepID=UPI00177CE2D1|nr:barstar family protein [Paenibacillus sp. JNUCC-31]QOS79088.1 barstar family protein [Paenibacillus sp. JNUCC-31]